MFFWGHRKGRRSTSRFKRRGLEIVKGSTGAAFEYFGYELPLQTIGTGVYGPRYVVLTAILHLITHSLEGRRF